MFRKRRSQDQGEKFDGKLEPLVLHNSRIKFSQDQLRNLNFIFNKKLQYEQSHNDKIFLQAKSIAERLIQRLLCAAGAADKRFSSKYLVDNNPDVVYSSSCAKSLTHLVRLDELSTPGLYELDNITELEIIENDSDCPPSYCRIRLPPSKMKTWSEFINPNGFLRRDRVQTRLVKLLAEAAENDQPISPESVDESTLCGIPGKVTDAVTLHHILKVPSFQQIYYGSGGKTPRFPDPSDFRIAIVDEPQGIMVRLEFLSPIFENLFLNMRLLVAIGVDAWPSSSNFPKRIPLIHPDGLLYHMAAETGMYLVGFGVQSSAWQMRVPAAEYTIWNHYGRASIIRTILDILKISEKEIDMPRSLRQYQSYKILNKYIFLTALFEELESNSRTPLSDAITWSSVYFSKMVLTILDKLMFSLTQQRISNYFFKQSNLMVNPGHLCEEDYIIEANNVRMYILKLFDESLQNFSADQQFREMTRTQENEINLLVKWSDLIGGMLPEFHIKKNGFFSTKSKKRIKFEHLYYTKYQLEYISMVLGSVLNVRNRILKSEGANVHNSNIDENEMEDVIYLTVLLMDQARENFLSKCEKLDKKQSKIKSAYSFFTSKFVQFVRDDASMTLSNLEEDIAMVEIIITMLHKAVSFNEKYLGRILQPYLRDLFEVTFAISWHLDCIKGRLNDDELKSLGCFCKLVNSGEITPAQGLVDASRKDWNWAKDMVELAEKHTLRIVLIPDREQVNQYVVYPNEHREESLNDTTNQRNAVKRRETVLGRNYYFSTIRAKEDLSENDLPQHELLKIKSPMNSTISQMYRKGEHRGYGDIFMSLLHIRKMGLFQEITASLSEEERNNLAEVIQELQDAKSRHYQEKSWTCTLPKLQKNVSLSSKDDIQRYKHLEESAGVRETSEKQNGMRGYDTLIRNCRTLRLKESNVYYSSSYDPKTKGTLRKSESFKY